MHFCKAIASRGWWAHRKHFTELHIASPVYPPCGRRAYGTIPHCFKRHPTWLIMILGIRAHSIRFQLTVQIDKGSTYFYVLSIQGTQLLLRNAQTANWYLNLNVLGYRYKKSLCAYDQHKKVWEYIIILEQNFIFTRAPRICHLYFDFQGFVYYTLVYLFTKWFLWKFVEEKITKNFWKYGTFSFFLKMTEI